MHYIYFTITVYPKCHEKLNEGRSNRGGDDKKLKNKLRISHLSSDRGELDKLETGFPISYITAPLHVCYVKQHPEGVPSFSIPAFCLTDLR